MFVKSGNEWVEQQEIQVSGAVEGPSRETYVALSSDGNTLAVGAPGDDTTKGAVWIFTRTSGVWSQQGSKITSDDVYVDDSRQGASVSLSADGNTLAVGNQTDHTYDNIFTGSVSIFTRTAGVWSQQGSKLIGTSSVSPNQSQGVRVCLSADGNTLLFSGSGGGDIIGNMWHFSRNGTTWSQTGTKIIVNTSSYTVTVGMSLSLSGDGLNFVTGSVNGNNGIYIFTR